jgi:starch synthase
MVFIIILCFYVLFCGQMRIAILTSEAVPFAKTGGLADVSGALPKALAQQGVDAKLILPLYDQIDRSMLNGGSVENVRVEWRGQIHHVRFWYSDAAEAPAYLLEAPEFFARPTIYGHNDDHIRFAFFSRAALALLKALDWQPDVVHGNDWPCGFAIAELRARRRYEAFFQNTKSLFSLHNVNYQGLFSAGDLWWLGFGDPPERDDFTLGRHASALKAGIIGADALSTVSPRYAREIQVQTPDQNHGLEWLLRARSNRLIGITNGVDYEIWNPETDPDIAANYSADDLSGKRQCKIDLLRRFDLPQDVDRPIIANISRLVPQKGYDLIQQISGWILETGSFFIALGAGEYEDFLQGWHERAPRQVGIYKGHAPEPLAHQIEAGADMFLMPSLYEPCGLNQMYSMRYGTVPIVRATGGLDDTVQHFNPADGTGTGFKFQPYDAGALLEKIRDALYFYHQPQEWQKIQHNGMLVDNSWAAAAKKYIEVYQEIAGL